MARAGTQLRVAAVHGPAQPDHAHPGAGAEAAHGPGVGSSVRHCPLSRRPGLRSLIADLRRESEPFRELWASHAVGFHKADTKAVHHPEVGTILLDCDTLAVPGGDLRITICSAAPGTEAAQQLALLATLGLQTPATVLD